MLQRPRKEESKNRPMQKLLEFKLKKRSAQDRKCYVNKLRPRPRLKVSVLKQLRKLIELKRNVSAARKKRG